MAHPYQERERLAATNEAAKVKQQAEFERQQQAQRLEVTRAVEVANSAAAKIADEKTNEIAVRQQLRHYFGQSRTHSSALPPYTDPRTHAEAM